MNSSTTEEALDKGYSFLVNVALAPYDKKGTTTEENANYNNDIRFQAVITEGVYGSAAHAARRLVEESPSNIFLAPILNRELEDSTVGTAAVELIYGDGYRTFVLRKDGPEPKSCRPLGVHLSIGHDDEEDPTKLPIIMPDDDFWHHVMNMYDPYGGKGIPTVYIRTSDILFLHPIKPEHHSSIALTVPSKRGFWTGLAFDGKRVKYPEELPKATSRKRKQPDEPTAKEGGDKKKGKKADDEDDDSDDKEKEKPKTKAPTKKKTPKKAPKEKDDDSDSDDEKAEEKPKKKAPTKKKTPKKIKAEPAGDESDSDDEKEKKKVKRKSTGSSKSKATKDKK